MADPTNETNPPPKEGLIPDPNASQSEQILGVGAHPEAAREKIRPEWRALYDKLVQTRDGLIDSVADLGGKAKEVTPDPVQKDQADVATESFQRDQLLGTVTYDEETLAEINDAIGRMEDGSYGVCLATGERIPAERLEAIPWARYTAAAQADMEAKGKTSQVAIGPRGDFHERGTAPAGPWRDKEGSI